MFVCTFQVHIPFPNAFLQNKTAFIPLNPEAYYLDHVPMTLDITSLLILNVGIVVVSLLVLIIPSAIITTTPPSRVIKYE